MFFGFFIVYDSLDSLVEYFLDGVFIYVVISVYFDIVKFFLKKGILVFMDKFLIEDYILIKVLYDLVKDYKIFLMVGFNCCFVLCIMEMKKVEDKNYICIFKNVVNVLVDF